MKASKVIRSIKTNTKEWYVLSDNDKRIVMSNGTGWFFVRYSNYGGFKITSPDNKVEMNYEENDVIAQQLWMCLVNILLGI